MRGGAAEALESLVVARPSSPLVPSSSSAIKETLESLGANAGKPFESRALRDAQSRGDGGYGLLKTPAGRNQFKRKLSIGVSSNRVDPKSARLSLGEGFLGVQDAKVFSNEVSLFVILAF